MTHLKNVDGQGQLLIGEKLSPTSYHVTVEDAGSRYRAKVEVQAPRDWLIRQGFGNRAILVLGSGECVEVQHDGPLDVADSISIVLRSHGNDYADQGALLDAFPELEEKLA